MNKTDKLAVLERHWNDNAQSRLSYERSTWEELVDWWKEEEKINWHDSWGKRVTSQLSCAGMCFSFHEDGREPYMNELADWMLAWVELPKKFAEDYCLYINDDKGVIAMAHKNLVMEFNQHRLLAGGEWLGLESVTGNVDVGAGSPIANREDDKLLSSIGEKFGDKPFPEAEFIEHTMSVIKEEAKTN